MALSLKISLEGGKMVKTMQFDPSTTVYDACRLIREKNPDTCVGELKDYGLFLISNEEAKKGIWLEPSRNLDYYILRNGDVLEYNKKIRNLRVRMLDGTVKTLLVDDSQVVANLMVVICTKIGITNYDEYGLVREEVKEEPDPCDKPNYGTLTLKRRHQEKERDTKMDQLRKKLHTDDEVNWVEGGKTLREQGISVGETLLLRRKLFYSDRNVDSRDPVQLALLYVQARDAILDGTHPVTQQRACEFAGIQCQIQFGDHKEDKHTTGFLDLKEFLPASYMKVKGIEKKVFKEHRQHIGLSELDAKVLYTKSARALNTYGVAFFLVKEKMKGKNKLVPRLLGVTKDSVLRLDEKTKETLQSWPLTTVRRWCASPNTFTLDFGDYSDQYYSVQTTEAEQILQVIAGYIDIILKRQRAKDHLGIEGDEGSAMVEDSVSPSKANIIQHDTLASGKAVNTECVAQPGVLRQPAEDQKSYAMSHLTGAQQTTVSGRIVTTHTSPAAGQVKQTRITSVLSEPQRALLSTINTGREIIKHTEMDLQRAELPELGADAGSMKWKQVTLDTNRQVVTSHIAAMNAATAQVVTLTSGPTEEVDHTAVGAAITTITSNLPEMTKGVEMIAALMDDTDNGDKLLDATRKLCSAFTDLLKAAEPETKEPRQNLLNAASRVGEASTSVLYTIGEETQYDKETQDILLSLAKAVANTTAALVLKAKQAAAHCKDDAPAQAEIIAAATHCALATSQLVACTKVVAGTLHSPLCREQLCGAATLVRTAVERLQVAAADAPASGDINVAAKAVVDALQTLLDHATRPDGRGQITESAVEHVMCATERLVSAADAGEMVRQAKLLGQATAHLIAGIKTEAEQQPSETQRKLLAAAKLLADATAKMVEAARQCASSPQDAGKQESLRRAAEELRYITVDYAQGQDIVGTQMGRLQDAARQAAASATQLITSAQNAAVHNTNKYSQENLLSECVPLQEAIPRLVRAANVYSVNNTAPAVQLDLITASEAFLQAGSDISSSARGVLPTVNDGASAKLLADNTHRFNNNCTELRSAVSRARISCKDVELDAAADIIASLQKELDELEQAARNCQLTPLPGQNAEYAMSSLMGGQREARSCSSRLVAAAARGEQTNSGAAACGLADALTHYTAGVTAAVKIYPEYHNLISSSRHVLESSQLLVETVKTYLVTPEQVDVNRLHNIANDINKSMSASVEAIPSHRELDHVTENINETLNILSMGDFPPQTERTYSSLQEELKQAAEQLSNCAEQVSESACAQRHGQLVNAVQDYGTHFNTLIGCCVDIVGLQENTESQSRIVSTMKTLTVNSSKLLTTAKSVSQDISRPSAKNDLAAAARAVTDSINELLDACSSAAPGQRECDRAVMRLRAMRPMLHDVTEPLNNLGYFACLDAVVDQSKGLSEGMSGMASAAKRSSHEQFANSVNMAADNICGLVEATAQAAYLVGVSDESSTVGRAGLVDQAQFSRAATAIQHACDALADKNTSQQQVLSAATVIAKHTSALCNSCRVASSRTTEPQPKRHFVQAAKDVANSTAALVKEIKALDQEYSEANRTRCAEATVPLRQAVTSLCQYADSPQFAAIPAKISVQARRGQESILECGRSIISASCSMIESAKVLSVSPTDKSQWQALATHSKTVSDSIKSLVNNIRDKAPGQKECSAALETVTAQQRQLDAAALSALTNALPAKKYHTLQGYTEQIESSATEMLERVEPLRNAAKREAENLGHAVLQLVSYVEPLVAATIGAASNITESKAQAQLFDQTKTVLESLSLLIQASKHAAGNPRATGAHPEIDSQATDMTSALTELLDHTRALVSHLGQVGGLIDSVGRSILRLTQHRMSLVGSYDESDSFVDYQTRMVANAKEIARLATDMCTASTSAAQCERLSPLSSELVRKYELLAHDAVGAAATTAVNDVPTRLRTCVADLGESCQHIIREGAQCRVSNNAETQRHVADAAADVGEKVVSVLSALQAGSKGTQACIDGAAKIAAIIGDLETTILFASAGTLQSENEHSSFSDHRESILKTAKRLVEDTKTLVGGAAGSQQQLAEAAHSATNTIVSLAEVSKLGAASLGSANPELQVMLLHAARDVAAALRDLAHATKGASGKHVAHPDMDTLKQTAKRVKDSKRWSLPTAKPLQPKNRRSSMHLMSKENSCDSETDLFVSDQEDELIKLLDYSSQDDDVSPSIFYDNCEDAITYIESFMHHPEPSPKNDDLNFRYNLASRNSLIHMDWRVLKYGENILLGEIKELVDLVVEASKKINHYDIKLRVQANNDLDSEMKRLSQVIEDLDTETEETITEVTIRTMQTTLPTKKAKLDDKQKVKLRNPIFKVKKVRPVNLIVNLDINGNLTPELKSIEPMKIDPVKTETVKVDPVEIKTEPKTPEQTQKSEPTTLIIKPEVITKDFSKNEFWKMFTDDSERWKALAKRNLDKMEETRRELARFSGHELNLDLDQIDRYTKEKQTLQSFIDDVDNAKSINKDLEYNEKYEQMVLKLIEFAKKDFLYKGFDPLIDRLKSLSNVEFERNRNRKINIQEIIDIYTKIDITEYTYEELCLLEKYYKEVIEKYNNKENLAVDTVRETKSASPTYHRNVILNIQSKDRTKRHMETYTGSLNRTRSKRHKSENNLDIFDLTRTYPIEYYANNWWQIYEDVLKSREQQYGSIENWWKFYEEMLKKGTTNDVELNRIRTVVGYRDKARRSRPTSRMEEQLRILDGITNEKFREVEDMSCHRDESVMVTNVTSLLKTVKAVEDEHTRGVRALESTIEAIAQEIGVLLSPGAPPHSSTAEELVRTARGLTAATASAVSAVSSAADGQQDQLVAAANRGRRSVVDLLHACKGAAYSACSDSEESRSRVLQCGATAAERYAALLAGVLTAVTNPSAKDALPALCRNVAAATADLIAVVDIIKGSDWVDPEDPTVIAEHELLGAAASIDAAAKKLDALRPRQTIKVQEADESLNFDEMILEAAKSIIAASSALVRAASASQRELIDQGKVARRPTSSSDDGQWSEGLVSAARLVAAAAHSLAESANALVQGAGSEERLVSAARQVASSTAQLLVACKVKADPSSESTRRLQAAGAQVIRSTDNLVSAARDSIRHEDERSLVLNRRMVGGIAQEIDARSEVLRIEKELEEARGRLSAIRQAKYRLKTGDTSGDDTDTDVCVGYTSDSSAQHRFKPPPLNNSSYMINTTYSPNSTQYTHNNTTQSIQQLNQSIHGSPSPYGYTSPKTPTTFNPPTQTFTSPTQTFTPSPLPHTPTQPYHTPQSQSQHTYSHNQQTFVSPPTYGQSSHTESQSHSNYSTVNKSYNGGTFAPKSSQTSTFSSFKPQQDDAKNYEGFTTRNTRNGRTMKNYETRLYDTPRPLHDYNKSEERQFESYQSQTEQKYETPMSPKFNARQLKFDDAKSDFFKRDGVGQNFSETQRSTEAIPGGMKSSEYTIKSESYSSYPKTEVQMTSTPNKGDLVKIATPDLDRMSSPYSTPNYMQETTTELKEIPNGTQKVTTTKIYSSSPVTMMSTDTKYEPVKLEGIDELSKSFDNDSRYSTLDSKYSSASRSAFMRPSEFQSDYQVTTMKPRDLVKEIDGMGKKFSQQTIKSETIERKSVMTSSHKSETSSTVTKKFGNF